MHPDPWLERTLERLEVGSIQWSMGRFSKHSRRCKMVGEVLIVMDDKRPAAVVALAAVEYFLA